VGLGRSEGASEPDELDRDLDHQPVVAAEVDAREVGDPAEPLPERVRVDEQRVGRGTDVPAATEELLQRGEQRRTSVAVVVGELRDRVDRRVAGSRLHGDAQQVLVGAELVVGDHAPVALHECRPGEGVTSLLEPVAERLHADTSARNADRRVAPEVRVDASQFVQQSVRAGGADGDERPQRLVTAIDERRARE